jgi:hypothetical protein
MMNDDELMKKIDQVSGDFIGQCDDLYMIVGMIVVGRLYGWRVVRLTVSRSMWAKAVKLFGDPKELMRERGKYAGKSVGLAVVDNLDAYWDVVKGIVSVPVSERRKIM